MSPRRGVPLYRSHHVDRVPCSVKLGLSSFLLCQVFTAAMWWVFGGPLTKGTLLRVAMVPETTRGLFLHMLRCLPHHQGSAAMQDHTPVKWRVTSLSTPQPQHSFLFTVFCYLCPITLSPYVLDFMVNHLAIPLSLLSVLSWLWPGERRNNFSRKKKVVWVNFNSPKNGKKENYLPKYSSTLQGAGSLQRGGTLPSFHPGV